MFDFSSCGFGPIGSDLGGLVALPNPAIRHRRLSLEQCLTAYRRGVRDVAGEIDPGLIGYGFRYRLLIKSLGWQLTRLPPPLRTDSEVEPKRVRIKRASVQADLAWLCDQASILLSGEAGIRR